MFWCDRYGDSKDCSGYTNVAVSATHNQEDPRISPVTERLGYLFINYQFVVKIDPSKSISLFWFEKDEHDGSAPMTIDNEGVGYRLDQDRILYAPALSQLDFWGSDETAKVYHIVAAVSQSSYNLSLSVYIFFRLEMTFYRPKSTLQDSIVPYRTTAPLST